jgi:hypothetical protein
MAEPTFVYTEPEWAASVGHSPLRDRPTEDLGFSIGLDVG